MPRLILFSLEVLLPPVVEEARSLEARYGKPIPVIAGGGWPVDLSRYDGTIDMYVDYVRVYDRVGGYGEPAPRGKGRLPYQKKR